MTDPGPWDEHGRHIGPTNPAGPAPDFAGPQQVPSAFPPPPRAANNRAGLMVAAVIAAVAVLAAAVVVVIQLNRGNDSTASAAPSSTTSRPAVTPVPANQLQSVRIAGPKLMTKPGSSEPVATLTVYEDFLCPFCGLYEKTYGATVQKLIDTGQIAVDYTMVSILGRGDRTSYSVRSGATAYCVADTDKGAFQKFHAALFADQPSESASTFPTNAQLLDQARQAGAGGSVADCVTGGKYLNMVNNAVDTAKIQGTPTIDLNGVDIADDLMNRLDPQTLIDKVNAITGNKQ